MIIMNSWQLFAVLKERELEPDRLQSTLDHLYYLVVDSHSIVNSSESELYFLL
jgi:hypothetical protein